MLDSRRYIAPGWEQIYSMLLDLAVEIRKSGFKADLIVGVSRGGWVPARVLSDLLDNARTANVRIEFYSGIEKTEARPVVTQPISSEISGKNALVVDDVSDTGWSLKVAIEHLLEQGASAVKTVTIYFKPHSIFKPDYFAGTTDDWIIFPWERLEAVRLLISEAKEHGRGEDVVRTILKKCNVDESTIGSLLQLASEVS